MNLFDSRMEDQEIDIKQKNLSYSNINCRFFPYHIEGDSCIKIVILDNNLRNESRLQN